MDMVIGVSSANIHGIEIGVTYKIMIRYIEQDEFWCTIIDEDGIEHDISEHDLVLWTKPV